MCVSVLMSKDMAVSPEAPGSKFYLRHFSELTVVVMNDLEILHRGLSDSAMEVQHI